MDAEKKMRKEIYLKQ